MTYSELINKKGSEKEYIQTAKLIKYGLSCQQIADVLERSYCRDYPFLHKFLRLVN